MKKLIQIPLLRIGAHGGTRVLIELANYAAERGFAVRLIYPRGRFEKEYSLHPSIQRVETPATGFRRADNWLFIFCALWHLRKGVLVANYFVTFYPVLLASLLFRRPYIYLVQDIETWFSGLRGFFLNLGCKLTWQSRRMISSSPYVRSELERRGYRLYDHVALGVAPRFFSEAAQASRQYDVIVFPRREPWKRLDRLLAIIKRYRNEYQDLRVLCVARTPELLAPFKALGCTCLQPSDEAQLITAFDSARVLLFTSEREGMGLPPLEGMARGLPAVIYQNGGSFCYMRDGENGFHIANDDEAKAVTSLHNLLSEPGLYAAQSVEVRRTAEDFSMARGFESICAHLEKL